jgi:hypothetical protein
MESIKSGRRRTQIRPCRRSHSGFSVLPFWITYVNLSMMIVTVLSMRTIRSQSFWLLYDSLHLHSNHENSSVACQSYWERSPCSNRSVSHSVKQFFVHYHHSHHSELIHVIHDFANCIQCLHDSSFTRISKDVRKEWESVISWQSRVKSIGPLSILFPDWQIWIHIFLSWPRWASTS